MAFSDVSGATSYFSTANEGFTTTTSGTTASGATSVGLNSVAGLTNGSIFVGVIEPGTAKEQVFTGTVTTASSSITGVVWTKGTNTDHATSSTVVDYDTGTHHNLMRAGILKEHNQSGTHAAVTATSVTVTGAVSTDTISEKTAATGVTVDSMLIKDGKVQTAGALSPVYTSNPYKFRVYRNAAYTPANGSVFAFDTKSFDTGSNVDVVTNKGRFTAPIAGFYMFTTTLSYSINGNQGTAYGAQFLKNGANVDQGQVVVNMFTGNYIIVINAATLIQLSASDYVEVKTQNSGTTAAAVGAEWANFTGFLVSAS